MKSKIIATSAYCISATSQKYSKNTVRRQRTQHGATLIELMVGITIGLLTITVAMGALMVSRGVSGTVSDASQLQQQSAYAFRVIGLQLRQAGSLYLNLAPQKAAGEVIDISDPVGLEAKIDGFDPAVNTLIGIDDPSASEYKLSVGYRNYKEPLHTSATSQSMQRNCLGETNSDTLIQSRFTLDKTLHVLRCAGSGAAQPFAENIANFEVRYLLQDTMTTPGNPQIRYASASDVGVNWNRVQGVEVCLVLFGTESIEMPAGSSYTDCDGSTAINMTTLTGKRAKRMHMVFRNVYQLRSQGLS